MVTIKQALVQANTLQQISESWKLDAELLLADSIAQTREYLFTWPSQELTQSQLKKFDDYCCRRRTGEPIAYILGRQAFWDFELKVTPSVLIPRPETELLVETALELLDNFTAAAVLDLGTGSGAIALALAANNSRWAITAVDSSESALEVAQENAKLLQLSNIEFRETSWCDGLPADHFDLIAANPPYVELGDKHLSEGSLPFEPIAALVARENGLADIRAIAEQSRHCLKKNSWLLIEHGFQQKQAVEKILVDTGYVNIECVKDLAKLDRLTKAQWLN
ncbi:MAG: protein-(glutamine-N5) methyltransferase, release factor-specific [SAR86 cluster bacterium]|uniref:Release factor glutamine methyltransferase n=1 Tax=SAR86 cluster bacterium TaxID=2030880 RepID=A0A2A4XER3_9GAMM|nr:MAG: protein-(glutamine-N5) methyltransferase, release factor-specific [SAR86 cluster bacterium]